MTVLSDFSSHVCKQLKPVLNVLRLELECGIQRVENRHARLQAPRRVSGAAYRKLVEAEGFREEDCNRLLTHLRSDQLVFDQLAGTTEDLPACCGDACLPGMCPGFDGKPVDFLVNVSNTPDKTFFWVLGDCKFELKPDGWILFKYEINFREEVDDKFENVESHFRRLGERVHDERVVCVTTQAYAQCYRLLQGLRLGKEPHAIIKNRYVLHTVKTISKYLRQCRRRGKKKS